MKTIVRLFDDVSIARDAVQELVDAGFDRQEITLMAYDPYGDYSSYVDRPELTGDVGEEAATGAGIGALIGGIGGLLLGLGALTITGIGPIVAAGPIAAALLGAGTGATVGGLVGLLMEADLDEEHAQLYAEGVRRGGTLVVVQTESDAALRAEQILDRLGPVDIAERSAGWRARGWSGYRGEDQHYDADEIELEQNFYTFEPVYRQHYQQTFSSQGHPYSYYEPAYYYGYDLVARQGYHDRDWEEIEHEVRGDWESRGQGNWEEFGTAVRHAWDEARQAVDMGDDLYYEDYEDWQPEFREHYETNYATSGRSYLDYDFAYRYGYDLAMDEGYEGRGWDDLEPEARGEWERRGGGAWEVFREAVQHAWNQVRDAFDFADDYDYFDEGFRQDYEMNFAARGYPYERYQPAYRYGYNLATDERFEGRDWEEIEPEARRGWQTQGVEGAWEELKDAVQRAWQEVRDAFETEDDYDYYGEGFRQHYQSNYGTSGYSYDEYDTAYRYGYDLAGSDYYRGRDWDEVEPEIRRNWEDQTDSPWEEFKGAVQHAWSTVTGALSGEETRERSSVLGNGCRQREAEFRRHYQSVYGSSGHPYTRYEDAYYYGCELAKDERYRGRSWDEVESRAQRDWQMRGEGPWDEFREAVRHAWREATGGSDFGARHDDLYRS
ncbi:MAG TPA: hypothetical protein VLC52_06960 [Anaerolineae bacterium]|nr:hypothetical protein [Anaerolineae bacterium]